MIWAVYLKIFSISIGIKMNLIRKKLMFQVTEVQCSVLTGIVVVRIRNTGWE